jgi:DNA-directed RNA polymerase beta subunit
VETPEGAKIGIVKSLAMSSSVTHQNISQYDDNKTSIEKYDLQVTESLKRINNLMKKIL